MRPVDTLYLLGLAAIWGASFLFMRIIAPEIGTVPTAFFRVSIAAAGLLVILAMMRVSWDFKGKFKTVLLLGVINSGIPATMYSVAAQVLPAGYSAIFNATTPLMGVLIGGLFFSERLTPSKIAGVALGLFGVAVLTRAGPVAFDLELLMGALACLLATTCYGFAGFLARRWLDQRGGLDSRLGLGQHVGGDVVSVAVLCLQRHQPSTGELGRLAGVVVAAGIGAGMYGVRLHSVLPPAVVHRPGQVDDRDLHDSAVRRVVGCVAVG